MRRLQEVTGGSRRKRRMQEAEEEEEEAGGSRTMQCKSAHGKGSPWESLPKVQTCSARGASAQGWLYFIF